MLGFFVGLRKGRCGGCGGGGWLRFGGLRRESGGDLERAAGEKR